MRTRFTRRSYGAGLLLSVSQATEVRGLQRPSSSVADSSLSQLLRCCECCVVHWCSRQVADVVLEGRFP